MSPRLLTPLRLAVLRLASEGHVRRGYGGDWVITVPAGPLPATHAHCVRAVSWLIRHKLCGAGWPAGAPLTLLDAGRAALISGSHPGSAA